jgi:hypothetical protein
MTETTIVVDGKTLSYEGLFSVKELYKMVDYFFKEKGYDKREIQNLEKVEKDHKYIEMELQPYKKITDYVKLLIRIRLRMFNIKEVEVEKDGKKLKLNKGKMAATFDGFILTDYEQRWEGKPMYQFVRTVFDKFIYKRYTSKFEDQVEGTVGDLYTQMKSFLNLYRY